MVLFKRISLIFLSIINVLTVGGILIDNYSCRFSAEQIDFPFCLDKTGIAIRSLLSYSGSFVEDRTNDMVENIVAAKIYNGSERLIESIVVELRAGDVCYLFEATMVPSGQEIILLDKNRSTWHDPIITGCSYSANMRKLRSVSQSDISVYLCEGDQISVINNTDLSLYKLAIYLRMTDHTDSFVGGYTYKIYIKEILPNDKLTINLYEPLIEKGRIVAVETTSGPQICEPDCNYKTLDKKS